MVTRYDIAKRVKQICKRGSMVYEKAYIYTGYYKGCKKYGAVKIGSTTQLPKHRFDDISKDFKPIAYCEFNNISHVNSLEVESSSYKQL